MSSTTFRRTALSLALLTLPATAALAADALPQVKIAVNDKQCEPMTLTIPAGKTQFIVITHRRGTMEAANVLYGVTMQEDGVSKLLKLDLEHVDATLVS